MDQGDRSRPEWNLRGIEERRRTEIVYSTQATEDMVRGTPMESILSEMARILHSGSSLRSLTLERTDGHAWRVSKDLGLTNAEYLYDGSNEDSHSSVCRPPEPLSEEDIDFLLGKPESD